MSADLVIRYSIEIDGGRKLNGTHMLGSDLRYASDPLGIVTSLSERIGLQVQRGASELIGEALGGPRAGDLDRA